MAEETLVKKQVDFAQQVGKKGGDSPKHLSSGCTQVMILSYTVRFLLRKMLGEPLAIA
jgi:hypothetical protein